MMKMKLSSKLYLGFAAVVFLLAVGAANSLWAIKSLDAAGSDAITSGENAVFLVAKEGDHLKWANKVTDLFLRNEKALHVTLDPTKCSLGKFLYGEGARKLGATDPQLAKLLVEIKGPHARLHKSAVTIGKQWKQNHPGLALTLADRLDDHRRWAASLAGSIIKRTDITVQLDPAKCAFGKWLAGEESQKLRAQWPAFEEIMAKVTTYHNELHASASKIKGELDGAAQQKIYFDETQPALAKVASLFMQAKGLESALGDAQKAAYKVFNTKTIPAMTETRGLLTKMVGIVNEQVQQAGASKKSTAEFTQLTAGLVAGIGILVGCLLAFFLTRSITKPINSVVTGLSAGAEQVAAASGQVSSASQSLAEGASEQASALEETSASLEEMASMTKQNADNAAQADGLMKDASKVVAEANASMGDLKSAMEKIEAASDETAKIIKTIDEIAFQTNLLALNAAVEAARAGEAGAGFAVVADEVRNLAMRAAEAAKNTQGLIEENINNIKSGSEMVTATDDSFSKVEANTQKVGELVAEIAGASAEQAQGIDQINTAATEMDRVTQQVAANAEESAAASEELSAQALTMNGHVDELAALIGGAQSANESTGSAGSIGRGTGRSQAALSGPRVDRPAGHKQITSGSRSAANPQDIIPLDGDDFQDF